ncbi:hypothetical protein D1B33_02805 [Lysinibacillus yapensis]|uniref:Uncharacterized protein n=1 Tax=Ureibacillus yapensis TaxID=2304605 RepID=A0A396SHN5_9BACL|nr:hypothetical protein [Lysinibacillus yapensis]RHW39798.1 hypothetical protein D1B33_02805 [Lysinibacillus yapensis]
MRESEATAANVSCTESTAAGIDFLCIESAATDTDVFVPKAYVFYSKIQKGVLKVLLSGLLLYYEQNFLFIV